MQLEIGRIYQGKVTEITKFGAFVEVEGKTGMVHISEIANTYVNEIKDHLKIGQEVKVKVINITEEGKISLSIKKALPKPERPQKNFGDKPKRDRSDGSDSNFNGKKNFSKERSKNQDFRQKAMAGNVPPPLFDDIEPKKTDSNFEDMLSRFKQASEEKFSDLKKINDNKRRTGARRR